MMPSVPITRLSGGLSPADGSDPRTFPLIFDEVVDAVEAIQGDVADNVTAIAAVDGRVDALDTDDVAEGANLYFTDARVQAIAAPLLFVENVRTASYTLELSDVAKVVAFNSGSALTVTIPANATVAFPVGTVVNVYRQGSGAVTVAAAAGVTLRNGGAIRDQFGEVSCRKRATNEWVVAGDTV